MVVDEDVVVDEYSYNLTDVQATGHRVVVIDGSRTGDSRYVGFIPVGMLALYL